MRLQQQLVVREAHATLAAPHACLLLQLPPALRDWAVRRSRCKLGAHEAGTEQALQQLEAPLEGHRDPGVSLLGARPRARASHLRAGVVKVLQDGDLPSLGQEGR